MRCTARPSRRSTPSPGRAGRPPPWCSSPTASRFPIPPRPRWCDWPVASGATPRARRPRLRSATSSPRGRGRGNAGSRPVATPRSIRSSHCGRASPERARCRRSRRFAVPSPLAARRLLRLVARDTTLLDTLATWALDPVLPLPLRDDCVRAIGLGWMDDGPELLGGVAARRDSVLARLEDSLPAALQPALQGARFREPRMGATTIVRGGVRRHHRAPGSSVTRLTHPLVPPEIPRRWTTPRGTHGTDHFLGR